MKEVRRPICHKDEFLQVLLDRPVKERRALPARAGLIRLELPVRKARRDAGSRCPEDLVMIFVFLRNVREFFCSVLRLRPAQIPPDERHDFTSRTGLIRLEGSIGIAERDLIFVCPEDRLIIDMGLRDIFKRGSGGLRIR